MLEAFFPGGPETVGCRTWGFGRGGELTSSIGILKQKQNETCALGLGRVIIGGRLFAGVCPLVPLGREGLEGRSVFLRAMSKRPSLSASVSKLVLSSSMGVFDIRGPGLDRADMEACSLCCQQYRFSSRGLSTRSRPNLVFSGGDVVESPAATGRRQGRPLDVIPRHVVAGFLESERSIRDSGVFAMKGMAAFSLCATAASFDAGGQK